MDLFKFRSGARHPVAADVVHQELEAIRATGDLTPAAIVAAATPVDSPLHAAFEWDDLKAGHAYRLAQARHLVRSVVIVRDEQASVPAFLNVRIIREEKVQRFYQHTDQIIEHPDEWRSAVQILQRNLSQAQNAVDEARRIAERTGRGDLNMAILTAMAELAATLNTMAGRIQ